MNNPYTGEEIRVYTNDEIDIRDTYVLPWEGPYTAFPNNGTVWADMHYWAPEVYAVNGAFYLFSAWQKKVEGRRPDGQRLCILKADDPLGPFSVVNDNLGPGNDPTLYQDPKTGDFYLIHNNGFANMTAHKLLPDFSGFADEGTRLFDRTDPDVTWSKGGPTEGPETYVTPTGRLLILWSSFCEGDSKKFAQMGFPNMDYGTAIAYNDAGDIHGPFTQENRMITPPNMGHVNLFETFGGQLMLAAHYPDDDENALGCSNPLFFKVDYDPELDSLKVDFDAFLKAHPEP